jgi:hypothetical protein
MEQVLEAVPGSQAALSMQDLYQYVHGFIQNTCLSQGVSKMTGTQ